MPKFLLKRWHGLHIVWVFVLLSVAILLLFISMGGVVGTAILLPTLGSGLLHSGCRKSLS